MLTLGIDPGKTGAVAVVGSDGYAQVWDAPDDAGAWGALLAAVVAEHRVRLAAVERVHSMPKQGVASTFKFGSHYGAALGALEALGVPYELVTPTKWQRRMLCAGPTDSKSRSLEAARRRYPTVDLRLKRHHGRADALHLARWAMIDARGEG